HGGIPEEYQLKLAEAVESFVNQHRPKADGLQCIMSEGSTQRAYYCWVRHDLTTHTYKLSYVTWNYNDPNSTAQVVTDLVNEGAVLVGVDAGTTQSVHYFSKIS
nr:hypothetical protein [Acidobacteriota bacterium]